MPVPNAMSSRGLFIALEGLDRCGKSTQATRLAQFFRDEGRKAVVWKFPDRTTNIGAMCSQYLQMSSKLSDQVIHLLFSANRWEKVEEMKTLLKEGTTVIVDRYAYSGVAYSYAKGTLPLNWCKTVDAGLPRPDIVLFLHTDENNASARSGFGDEIYENTTFQKKVAGAFEMLYDENYWTKVDGNSDIDNVHRSIVEVISKLKVASDLPAKLWPDLCS